jgi:hypothetical protein
MVTLNESVVVADSMTIDGGTAETVDDTDIV